MFVPDAIAPRVDVVRRYFAALEVGDTSRILSLFHPSGEVLSPFLGRMEAASFFARLAESSQASETEVFDIFPSPTTSRVAAYFHYRWTLRDGSVIEFDCCDIFDFVAASGSDETEPCIRTLTIIYDTAPIRADVGDKYA
ncbi:nuclear transport factor 2 family protein [Nonomuraea indica]|uniref:Nuclear transport factor 2 family protein n=1 Tax=Nonomuraea indica TaxID=1581193 RepID=A0ABW8AAJ1_9ACTN